jgi:hypothetical protein
MIGVAWGDPLTEKATYEHDLVPVHVSFCHTLSFLRTLLTRD